MVSRNMRRDVGPLAEMTMEAPPNQGYLEPMIDPDLMQVLEQLRSDVANVETRLREHVDTVGTRLREHVADVETGLRAARCAIPFPLQARLSSAHEGF